MSVYQSHLASVLVQILGSFVRRHQIGWVVGNTLFQLNSAGTLQRRPHVAFVSYDRWPKYRGLPDADAWKVVPDLAIEVNNPANQGADLGQIIADYFESGVQRIWVVYPDVQKIHVFSSPVKNEILSLEDELKDEGIFPGFHLSLTELFEDGAEAMECNSSV